MKAIVESTTQIVELDALDHRIVQKARVWKGTTEGGIDFEMVVIRVAVSKNADAAEFERDLQETHAPPAEPSAFSLRMVL